MLWALPAGASTPAAGEEPPALPPEPDAPSPRRQPSVLDTLLETRPDADAPPLVRFDLENRRAVAYLAGQVEWSYEYRGETVYLQADRLLVEVRLPPDETTGRERGGDSSSRAGPGSNREADRAGRDGILPEGLEGSLRKVRDFRFFAEGHVRLEVPGRRTFLEAESFYYEHLTGRGVARDVRLRTTYTAARGVTSVFQSARYVPRGDYREPGESELLGAPLTVRAELLRMDGFEWFGGTGIDISTCDFAVPHYSIRAASVTVVPVEEGAATGDRVRRGPPPPGEEGLPEAPSDEEGEVPAEEAAAEIAGRDLLIDPESSWLAALDHRIVPLPISNWDTRWHAQFPVRSADVGSSSKYGFFGGLNWNLNYFLNLVPLERVVPLSVVEQNAKLGLETDAMTKRGFGLGPVAEYGERADRWQPWQLQLQSWRYYGEAQYYYLDDQGDEDRSTGLPPPTDDRYWGHVWHRQSIPYVGLLDLEVSKISDRAFLREFFEEVAKDEKEQENLAYLRRNITDNLAATGLYQVRGNDFQSQTERVPEGKIYLFEQPIFRTGLYTGLQIQAAYLRRLEDDALGIDPETVGRFDALNEWSYPFSLGRYLQVRPFALARYSLYGETAVSDDTEDRATVGAGVSVSQEWSRIYHLDPGSVLSRFLGTRAVRHSVTPEVSYLNVFYNGYDPEDLIQIDGVDTVDLQESIAFTLRNQVLIRQSVPGKTRAVEPTLANRGGRLQTDAWRTRTLLDSDVSFVLYPREDRDNDGDLSSLLRLDNTIYVTERLYARGWFELDPNDSFDLTRVDASIGFEVVPRSLWLSVGDRYTSDRTNYVYTMFNWNLTEKWGIDAYYAHDFETGEDVEYNVSINRIFHRFVVSFDVSLDVGEDDNLSVAVSLSPVEVWRPVRSRIPRTF